MTDSFNLQKNPNYKNTQIAQQSKDGTDDAQDNKNKTKQSSCADKDGQRCDHIIMEGFNIGWIWNWLGNISSFILQYFGMKNDSNVDTNISSHTNTKQLNEIEQINTQVQHVQQSILVFIIGLICLSIFIALVSKPKEGEQFYGITQISYFIRELIQHPKKYNIVLFTGIAIVQFMLGWDFFVSFITSMATLWIFIGNFMLKKKNTILILPLIFGFTCMGLVLKSTAYYRSQQDDILKKLGEDADEDIKKTIEKKKGKSITVAIIFSAIISISVLGIVGYLLYKLYALNTDSNNIELTGTMPNGETVTYNNLSEYLQKEIFDEVTEEQDKLIITINSLTKEYTDNNIATSDTTYHPSKQMYDLYIKQLIDNVVSKDNWIKKCITYFQTKTYTPSKLTPLDSEAKKTILSMLDINKKQLYTDDFNALGTYIGVGTNDSWKSEYMISNYALSVLFRTLEIGYQTIGTAVITVWNYIDLLFHFIFHSPNKKIKTVNDLNIFTFNNFELLFSSDMLLTHRRVAKMFDLLITTNE
jgi:transcription termination factor NusB